MKNPDFDLFLLSILNGKSVSTFSEEAALETANKATKSKRTLFPLLCAVLKERDIDIPDHLYQHYLAQIARSVLLEQAWVNLSNIGFKNGIEIVAYKGCELAKLYKWPHLRPQADIDALVNTDNIETLNELLLKSGFTFSTKLYYHRQYFLKPFFYEVHTSIVAYKYELFFELKRYGQINKSPILTLSAADYLLLSCLQVYDDMTRLIPFLDMYLLAHNNIDALEWENLLSETDSAFLLHFCNERMVLRYGYSPLSRLRLPRIRKFRLRLIRKAAISATKPRETYLVVFLCVRNPLKKAIRVLFPPKEARAAKKKSHLAHVFKHLIKR